MNIRLRAFWLVGHSSQCVEKAIAAVASLLRRQRFGDLLWGQQSKARATMVMHYSFRRRLVRAARFKAVITTLTRPWELLSPGGWRAIGRRFAAASRAGSGGLVVERDD